MTPSRRSGGGTGERDRSVARPGAKGATALPTDRFRSPGGGEGQAAATGELVARAVAMVLGPVTFMWTTITRPCPPRHPNLLPGVPRDCPARQGGGGLSPRLRGIRDAGRTRRSGADWRARSQADHGTWRSIRWTWRCSRKRYSRFRLQLLQVSFPAYNVPETDPVTPRARREPLGVADPHRLEHRRPPGAVVERGSSGAGGSRSRWRRMPS